MKRFVTLLSILILALLVIGSSIQGSVLAAASTDTNELVETTLDDTAVPAPQAVADESGTYLPVIMGGSGSSTGDSGIVLSGNSISYNGAAAAVAD